MKHNTQQDKAEALQGYVSRFATVAAKITLRFGFLWREFMEFYKRNLVLEAKKQNPEYSTVEISGRTGIDRRLIAQYLKEDEVVIKPSKVNLTLKMLKMVCQRTGTQKIRKFGPFQTFESVCNQTAYGTLTPNAIAKELMRQGNIKDCGEHYELADWKFKLDEKDDDENLRVLSVELDRLTDTLLENVRIQDADNRKFQRNIFSTQIPPDRFAEVNTQIRDIMRQAHQDIDDVLSQHEDKVPLNTYPAYGASMFVFGPPHNRPVTQDSSRPKGEGA